MNGMDMGNGYGMNAAQNRLNMLERRMGMGNGSYGNGYANGMDMQMGMGNGMNTNMGNMGMNNQQVQMQMYKGRPVSNFSEANASLIDMDGSLHVFPDLANKRVYTKRINLDGMSEVKTYALIDNPVEELNQNKQTGSVEQGSAIGRQEFESYMKVIGDRFDNVLIQLNNLTNTIMGGMNNGNANEWNATNVPAIPTDGANAPTGTKSTGNGTANAGEQPIISEGTANGKRENGR